MVTLIDTHAHLDAEQLACDLTEVIARAHSAGVAQIVSVGISAPSSRSTLAIARAYPNVFATVGIHPNEAARAAATDWDDVLALGNEDRVVGIGETGLDRHWDDTPFAMQEDYFARHLELARNRALAIVIHCREAEEDVVRMLREEYDRHGPIKGVMHSFAGSLPTAQACLQMGLHISFAGMLTYKNAQPLRDVAARVGCDRLLVETDSPYLSPVPLRGRRNEPSHVVHTAGVLADLHHLSLEDLAEQTTANARALFGLPG